MQYLIKTVWLSGYGLAVRLSTLYPKMNIYPGFFYTHHSLRPANSRQTLNPVNF